MSECEPSYTIRYYGGTRALDQPLNIQGLSYGRRLDDISNSQVDYIVSSDACCQFLTNLEPYRDAYGIYRNGELTWYGWIQTVEYNRGIVSVRAMDGLRWLQKRVVHDDLKYVNTDQSDIFEGIYHSAMDLSPVALQLDVRKSGTLESRTIDKDQYRLAWNIVREMLDTGLDVTVYGQTIVVGQLGRRPIEMKLTDAIGNPSLTKDGGLYANRIIANVAGDVVGIYPPGNPQASDNYPLVEEVITDGQIPDVQSAVNIAKSRYDFSKIVPRVVNTQDGITLQPSNNIKLNNLICGQLINLTTTGICYDTRESFRLGTVDVVVSGGVETIKISLQPVGTLGTLDSSETAGF